MRPRFALAALGAVTLALAGGPSARAATEDACSVLTAAQVGAAAGVKVGAGTHPTPTFLKTCTWTATDDHQDVVRAVTLMIESEAAFEKGKQLLAYPNAKGGPVSGVGDDAFCLILGPQVGLAVKKGSAAFKVEVYGGAPVDKKKEIEKTLAVEAASKL